MLVLCSITVFASRAENDRGEQIEDKQVKTDKESLCNKYIYLYENMCVDANKRSLYKIPVDYDRIHKVTEQTISNTEPN